MPGVQESRASFFTVLLSPSGITVIPFYETLYLPGNNGNFLFAPIAPLILLLIANGLTGGYLLVSCR
jgi:hypothetical protein